MHTFKLTGQRGETFLAQDRKDPITGDAFAAGDEVVFCAHCRSAFHVSSWEYLGGKHCEQEKTLDAFPVQKKLKLVQKTGAQLYPRPLTPEEAKIETTERYELYYLVGGSLLLPLGILTIDIIKFLHDYFPPVIMHSVFCFIAGTASAFKLFFLKFVDVLFGFTTLLQSSGEKVRFYQNLISIKPFWWKRKVYRNRELEKLEVRIKKNTASGDKVHLNFHFRKGAEKRTRLFLGLDGELEKLLEALVLLSFHLPVRVASENVGAFYVLEHLREVHQAPLEIVGK